MMSVAAPSAVTPPPPQKPSIGRIVVYRVKADDDPALRSNNAILLPAIIVRVFLASSDAPGETVNLKVLCDGRHDVWLTSVHMGDEVGQWSWPPRV